MCSRVGTSLYHFKVLTLDFLAVIFAFTQTFHLFCRQRFFDTDELFTKSRQPFCSPLSHNSNRLCASLYETIFPLFSSSYSINIGVWSTSVRVQQRTVGKHPQFEDPTRLSNTPTYGSHLKGFAQQPFEASASRASGQRTIRTSGQ